MRSAACTIIEEEISLKEGNESSDLNRSVEHIGLSVRSRNCLRAAGVRTVGELQGYTAETLLALPNFGRTSLEDVEAALADLGLQLKVEISIYPDDPSAAFSPAELQEWQKGMLTMSSGVLRAGVRVSEGLARLGCDTIADVVRLNESDLLRLDNFGRRSVAELRAILKELGFWFGMLRNFSYEEHEPVWSEQYRTHAIRHLEARFQQHLDRMTAGSQDLGSNLRGLIGYFLDGPTPELLDRNTEMLSRLYGWGGDEPITLEKTAQPYGLARERVRQISKRFIDRLPDLGFTPRWLLDAIAAMQAIAPCPIEEVSGLLAECGVTLGDCDPRGVLCAASLFAEETGLQVPRHGRMQAILCTNSQARLGSQAASRARMLTSRYGCFSIETLLARLDPKGSDAVEVRRMMPLIVSRSGIVWLDAEKQWGFTPNVPRSRLFSVIRKVLSLDGVVGVDELRSAVRRDLHMEGFAPRRDILLALLKNVSWATVEGTSVRGVGLDRNVELVGNHRMMAEVLLEAGGVLDRFNLVERCTRRGMNSTSCQLLITHSPVVTPLSPYVFAIPGCDVPPGTVERLTPAASRERVVQDYGWAADGRLWVIASASPSVVANGLLNIPNAFSEYLQGRFEIVSPLSEEDVEEETPPAPDSEDDPEATPEPPVQASVNRLMLVGLRPALIERAAEVGDSILLIFDTAKRTLELRVGDENVAAEFA